MYITGAEKSVVIVDDLKCNYLVVIDVNGHIIIQ